MNFKLLPLALFFYFVFFNSIAQVNHELTFEKCIELAKMQSYQMLRYEADLKLAQYHLNISKSYLKTSISYNLSPTYFNNMREVYNGTNDALYKTNHYLDVKTGFNLTQPLPTGGYISFNPGISIEGEKYFSNGSFVKANYFELRPIFSVSQPIEYNRYQYSKKSAELSFELAKKRYEQMKYKLVYDVSLYFYRLVNALENLKTQLKTIELTTEALQLLELKPIKDEAELYKLKIDIKQGENNYNLTKSEYIDASNSLKELLKISQNDSIKLLYSMDYYGYDINIDETTNKALNQRHEIQEKLINIDLYNLERKLIKSQGLPRGEIHANFNPYGNDESDITAPFFNAAGYSVKESYQRLSHLNDLSIGFSVYVPILDGKLTKNRVKAIQTQIQLTEYEKEELEQNITKEIHTLVKQIENTYYMLHLLDESVTIAEKNIELSNEAFQNNKINSYLYALDIKRWEQSNLSRIEANITYNLLIKKLEYETLDNLKVINSIK